jgi:hypothetical protein
LNFIGDEITLVHHLSYAPPQDLPSCLANLRLNVSEPLWRDMQRICEHARWMQHNFTNPTSPINSSSAWGEALLMAAARSRPMAKKTSHVGYVQVDIWFIISQTPNCPTHIRYYSMIINMSWASIEDIDVHNRPVLVSSCLTSDAIIEKIGKND